VSAAPTPPPNPLALGRGTFVPAPPAAPAPRRPPAWSVPAAASPAGPAAPKAPAAKPPAPAPKAAAAPGGFGLLRLVDEALAAGRIGRPR